VIYFNRLADGKVWLMTMYAKNVREDVDVRILIKLKETLNDKTQGKGASKIRSQP